MTGLHVAKNLTLPVEMVTETVAFLAKRGMGKSNAAVVMAEEMTDSGYQWVAIDPKGDWWGIRSDAKGTGPGLPVPVFGGLHGDLPLEPGAGALMARLVIARNMTCVLDVSNFSKAEQIKFVTAFAETLWIAIRDSPRPMHLFLEEAEEFLPQNVRGDTARMVGAYSKISKQGRTHGLGVTLITQRSASINKDALSQTDTLVLFRTVSPHDRKAVNAWADHNESSAEVASTLSSLKPGESWILSPGFLGKTERVQWRRRRTFDSGATPTVTRSKRRAPVTLADIDIADVAEMLDAVKAEADANDPKVLKRKVADLEKQLAAALRDLGTERTRFPEREVVEVPVLGPEAIDLMNGIRAGLGLLGDSVGTMTSGMDTILDEVRRHLDEQKTDRVSRYVEAFDRGAITLPRPTDDERMRGRSADTGQPRPRGDLSLGKSERAVLTVLAQFPTGRTHAQIAMLTGYSPKASTIGVALSKLRRLGYVQPGTPIMPTAEGVDALGPVEALPTGEALLAYWKSAHLGSGEIKVLDLLIDAYLDDRVMTKDEIADGAGYSRTASTVGVALSKLRRLLLVEGFSIAPDFAAAIGL